MTSLDLLAIHYSADYEGFNTRDLRGAEAMLEELASWRLPRVPWGRIFMVTIKLFWTTHL
jgi:hypothetical protein